MILFSGSSKPDKHIELKQKVVDFFAEDQALLGQSGSKLM